MRRRSGLLILAVAVILFRATGVSAQNARPRAVPGCAAAVCEEGTAVIAALDTLLRFHDPCGGNPPRVLQSMHLAPYTSFSDGVAGRPRRRLSLPSSPEVLRVDDLGPDLFGRYWKDVRVVSAAEVEQGGVPAGHCLYVFSPVTWLGPDRVRVVVARSRENPMNEAQYFVFLERGRSRWNVTRIETGYQS